jgi:nitrite reductase/ring-hydroxylating ferredoxin subunit
METSTKPDAKPHDGKLPWHPAGSVADIRAKGVVVVKSAAHPIAVFASGEGFLAVDNRCPHLGFPLAKGTVKDGILTCHWHHANFDLKSGCTFDTWADDIPSYVVRVVGTTVEVAAQPKRVPDLAFHGERLRRGLDHGLHPGRRGDGADRVPAAGARAQPRGPGIAQQPPPGADRAVGGCL